MNSINHSTFGLDQHNFTLSPVTQSPVTNPSEDGASSWNKVIVFIPREDTDLFDTDKIEYSKAQNKKVITKKSETENEKIDKELQGWIDNVKAEFNLSNTDTITISKGGKNHTHIEFNMTDDAAVKILQAWQKNNGNQDSKQAKEINQLFLMLKTPFFEDDARPEIRKKAKEIFRESFRKKMVNSQFSQLKPPRLQKRAKTITPTNSQGNPNLPLVRNKLIESIESQVSHKKFKYENNLNLIFEGAKNPLAKKPATQLSSIPTIDSQQNILLARNFNYLAFLSHAWKVCCESAIRDVFFSQQLE